MKEKKYSFYLFIGCAICLILSQIITANSNSVFWDAIGHELFTTILMSFMVLLPLSIYFANNLIEVKQNFIKLFIARLIILLVFDLVIPTEIAAFDASLAYPGLFICIILLITKALRKKTFDINTSKIIDPSNNLTCPYCHSLIKFEDKFCTSCGKSVTTTYAPKTKENIVLFSSFGSLYAKSDEEILTDFIKKELKNADIDENTTLIPSPVLKKKKTMIFIFSLLLLVFVSSIFFHFPLIFYIIFLILLIIMYFLTNHYDLMKYLKKEIKSRPQEKISNIVMNIKNSLVTDDSKASFIGCAIVALAIPMMIFFTPRIMYEQNGNGYYVRFYTSGVINNKKAVIPDTYKGKPVIGLRGNTFSNMPFLEYVYLPDTITEIRGQAFKNDKRLKEVKLPSKLTYLGGGAFYNCSSITSIELPDTLNFLGGEAFKDARNLQSIKLSNKLTEIRGNTFENCTSLTSIKIPDTVIRIGGHAFYGCSSLREVNISVASRLESIGSSAFRKCINLRTVNLPKGTSVNSRSFKESPTTINYYDINQIISKNNFKKNETIYFSSLGEEKIINTSHRSYKTYKTKIKFYNAIKDLIYYTYSVQIEVDGTPQIFTFTHQKPYTVVNDNLVIYIENNSSFTKYDNSLYLKAYYN